MESTDGTGFDPDRRERTTEGGTGGATGGTERHMVKVADWVAAMICDATKRVREWDMERKKVETGSSGSEETDKETENGEKAEVGGGEDGTVKSRSQERQDGATVYAGGRKCG